MTVYRVADVDDEIQLDLSPKEATPKLHVEAVLLRPDLSLSEAEKKWTNKPIDKGCIKHRPTVSTYYHTPDGKAKLLFLRDVLDADTCAKAWEHIRNLQMVSVKGSRRACLKGSPGEDLLLGYKDQLQLLPQTGRRQTYPQLSAASVHQFPRFRGMWPLCWKMEDILREYIPDYWVGRELDDKHGPTTRDEGNRSDFFMQPGERHRAAVEAMENWELWYNIPGSNFTTITVNHNTRFLAHKDANNSSGALSCLAAFGRFAGGELCFPRLGVALNVKERDMLVCDCPQELHGTLSTPQGNRYTVVTYTREGLTKNGMKAEESKRVTKRKPSDKSTNCPFDYTPNFLTKEEANELAVYFETLEFHVRKTKWGKEIKRQSRGYIARDAFNDRKGWGTEYADIGTMPEILQRFRQKLAKHAGREINYISILKYPNSDAIINWHNHREDHWHKSPVWDVTIGPTERKFWAREVANPKNTVTSVLAEVGSLITLPASMNTTHEHAILKDKTTGVRYSINCKSLPLYAVWECRAGKNYPPEAVYVGCRVCDRKGNVIREGTIFGNGTNPLVSHKGALETEEKFREYAERKMQEPEFRAKVQELRGKHLLCWCVQAGPKRAAFCHARVWLELANRD